MSYRKTYKRVRYVNFLKRSAHTVLSADRCTAHSRLRINRTKQCRRRVSPRFFAYSATEEFLERQTAVRRLSAHTGNFCKGRKNRRLCSVPGRPFANARIISLRHKAYGRRFIRTYNRNFCAHTGFRRTLVFSAVREQNG